MTAICVNAPPMPVRTGAVFFCSFFSENYIISKHILDYISALNMILKDCKVC